MFNAISVDTSEQLMQVLQLMQTLQKMLLLGSVNKLQYPTGQ